MLDPVQVPMAFLDRLKDLLEDVQNRAIEGRLFEFPMEDLKDEAHACELELEPLRWPRPLPPPLRAVNADYEAEALKTLDLDRE